jgi:quercetin dioxygenase-like cupin family protein
MKIVQGRQAGTHVDSSSSTFTGVVWRDSLLEQADGASVYSVFFSPEARTYWHRHERGQLLLVTGGEGWVCGRDLAAARIRVGDMVWTSPGEEHWHGATRGSFLLHTAVSLGTTEWLEEAGEGEYARATGDS